MIGSPRISVSVGYPPGCRFGTHGDPLSVRLHRNQIANRFVVDTLGYSAWSVIIARNRYERLEKAGDWAAWILAGFVLPYFLQHGFNQRYNRFLRRKFHLSGKAPKTASLLQIPFEWLDRVRFSQRISRLVVAEERGTPQVLSQRAQMGLPSFRALSPGLARHLLQGKLLILWANLFLMALKGQTYLWAKNWMTERLSGQKGFSGEFRYATKAYLQQQSRHYEKTKRSRMLVSMSLGFGSAFALPLLLWGILKSPWRGPWMRALKALVPAFNYTQAIFMSKWVLLWINVFNWTLPTLLASRDRHELRENLTKLAAFDLLFFLGDDIIAGLAAHYLSKGRQKALGIPIVRYATTLRLPRARALHEVYEAVGRNKKHLAYRLARQSFWLGILGTSLALGVTIPLLNFWYTRQKVLSEQVRVKHGLVATRHPRASEIPQKMTFFGPGMPLKQGPPVPKDRGPHL